MARVHRKYPCCPYLEQVENAKDPHHLQPSSAALPNWMSKASSRLTMAFSHRFSQLHWEGPRSLPITRMYQADALRVLLADADMGAEFQDNIKLLCMRP
jgi:hypothetical protein